LILLYMTKIIITKEALNNSSMNYQSTKKIKCDFIFFSIFSGLSATENGNTSMCCGNSELIRVSLTVMYVSAFMQYAGYALFRLDFLGLDLLGLFDGVDLAGTKIGQVGYIDFCAQLLQRGTHHLHFFVHNMDMVQHSVNS